MKICYYFDESRKKVCNSAGLDYTPAYIPVMLKTAGLTGSPVSASGVRELSAGDVLIIGAETLDPNAAENIKKAVLEAERYGIAVCLECHRWTMTEDPGLAVRLAERTGCLLHFQPNPDISFEENLSALKAFSPYLCALHVFAWEKGDVRLPLIRHKDQWIKYAMAAGDVPFLLEFVAENDPENLKDDAAALAAILEICDENRA